MKLNVLFVKLNSGLTRTREKSHKSGNDFRYQMPIKISLCLTLILVSCVAETKASVQELQKALQTIGHAQRRLSQTPLGAKLRIEYGAGISDQTDTNSFWTNLGDRWAYQMSKESALFDGHNVIKRTMDYDQDFQPRHFIELWESKESLDSRRFFDPIAVGYSLLPQFRLEDISTDWISTIVSRSHPTSTMSNGLLKLVWKINYANQREEQAVFLDPKRNYLKVKETLRSSSINTQKSSLKTRYLLLKSTNVRGIYLPSTFIINPGSAISIKVILSDWRVKAFPLLSGPIAQVGDIRQQAERRYVLNSQGGWELLPSYEELRKKDIEQKEAQETRQYAFLIIAIAAPGAFVVWVVLQVIDRNKKRSSIEF